MTRFDTDTGLEPVGEGVFEGRIDPGWFVFVGPNGGYVAAIVLRGMTVAVGDDERVPRSLTVHYTEPPVEGPIRVMTAIERAGRSMTTVSARMTQDGRTLALALAAFSRPRRRPALSFVDLAPPDVPPADEAPAVAAVPGLPPITERYDTRPVLGSPPFAAGDEALSGGWLRLAEPRLADPLAVVAYTDAWLPAVFTRTVERVGVPTVDLTVHFRSALPLPDARPEDFVLCRFHSRVAAEGFLEEDGELWSAGGTLLAQSRQLAVVVPV